MFIGTAGFWVQSLWAGLVSVWLQHKGSC